MKPVVLVILDGWGVVPEYKGNAIANAAKPNFDFIEKNFPFALLQASGIPVGLPWGEPGNSEVGHAALGTGQIRHQALTRITLAIQNGSFFKNPVLKMAADKAKENNSAWHLVGLLGSGSVHSYIDHLYALLEMAKNENVKEIWLHLFTDGRDSPPKEAATAIENLESRLKWLGAGKIASVIGRLYAMDRDLNWDRTEKTYRLLTEGLGEKTADFTAAIKKQYAGGVTDEFIEPMALAGKEIESAGTIKDGDAVIFFNFREDSARQLARAFAQPDFNNFPVKKFKNLFIATLTQYEKKLAAEAVFKPNTINNFLSRMISERGLKQFKIAETEKYAHATYFFNGGWEESLPGETRKLVHSAPQVRFNESPAMKAPEITSELCLAIAGGEYDFLLANFANADMMGHSGDYEAAVKAVQVLDESVGKIMKAVLAVGGTLIITSDHGNADEMINRFSGEIFTEHSSNPVPCYLIMNSLKKPRETKYNELKIQGILQDVAATVLDLLGISPPGDMDGQSLLPMLYKQ
ncbi:MAG: 2,3-bisphosphoglycerate-independent phosphoglycerate mutase [Parcubacteria group bacterium]|nr:2,3-bisphosphoglycerate-independent phosphoglycerate mutase [Parcubacteria group bacterium]